MLALLLMCAVCATADPALESNVPYRGRLRLEASLREGSVSAGTVSLDDTRLEMGAAWSPLRALEIGLITPFLFRRVDGVLDERTLGDVELRAQLLAWEARGAFGRRRVGLLGALKGPTAPIGYDESHMPLPSALQPGCGSIAPLLGVYYATGKGAWSERVAASLFMPISVRAGPHASDSLRMSAQLQFQPSEALAMRVGAFARVDADGQLGPTTDDPNSGGFIADVTGELIASPTPSLVFTLGMYLPVVEAFRGTHREGAIVSLGVGYDFR